MRLGEDALGRFSLLAAALSFGIWTTPILSPCLFAQQSATRTVKIPDGTLVPVYLKDDLSSKKNKANDPIRFQVRADVRVNGVVVIPAGTLASGRVNQVGGAGFAGHAGKLSFSVDSLKTPDGTTVPLRGSPTLKGGSSAAVAAAATAAYGPAGLFIRGSHADIRKGTMLTAYVDGDREVAVKVVTLSALAAKPPAESAEPAAAEPDAAQPTPAPSSTSAPATSEDSCTVVVKSNPGGAEISVDGNYVGSTTSTLRLTPGEHTIAVRKSGYQTWQRTMTANAGGNVTIDAPLQAQKKALRLDQITELLAGSVSSPRVIRLVKERGVTFQLDDGTEQRLRAAGAGDDLITAIRETPPNP
jgi:hypothetical protein